MGGVGTACLWDVASTERRTQKRTTLAKDCSPSMAAPNAASMPLWAEGVGSLLFFTTAFLLVLAKNSPEPDTSGAGAEKRRLRRRRLSVLSQILAWVQMAVATVFISDVLMRARLPGSRFLSER